MSDLMLRIIELKEEYFNGFNKHDLCYIHDMCKEYDEKHSELNHIYTSDELISIMATYDMNRCFTNVV